MSSVPFQPTDQLATLRAWFDIAPDAMIAVDQEGRIALANAQAERLFGYEHKELCELTLEALIPEPLRHAHRLHRGNYMRSPKTRPMGIGYELLGVTRDGREFPVEIGLSPIPSAEGVIAIASIRDISETRRVRQTLERARLDTVVGEIGRLVLEAPGLEQAIHRIPGIVLSELKVQAVAILSTDWHREGLHVRASSGLAAQAAEALVSTFYQVKFIRTSFAPHGPDAVTTDTLDDSRFPSVRPGLAAAGFEEFAIVPLFGRTEPLGVLVALASGVRFDPDQVNFLRSIANLLAAAVQRSRAEEQLLHAQKLEAVGQLTGGIAHDFNNLLTVISGNLQLLEAELPEPEVQEIIASAMRAVDRGADLVRRLLTFARRQSLQPRAVVPKPLLEELGHMLRRTLGEAVAVEIDCATDMPDVYADPNELDTALVNLALNARDAMPRGGCLSIAAREVTIGKADNDSNLQPGRYVSFEVGDTGTGMSPEVRARALDPFFTTKESGKGSGLGLSMVYGFVTQSGGNMAVESRLGYGTRVKLLLPATAPKAAAEEPGVSRVPVSERHETVLVVEDEADVRSVAERFLRAIGYNVISAASARSALDILVAENQVDLLFSDVVLGSGMDGIELARQARSIRPQLAVLLTSGYPGSRSELRKQEAMEAFELLRKPYRREDLAIAVKRALDPS